MTSMRDLDDVERENELRAQGYGPADRDKLRGELAERLSEICGCAEESGNNPHEEEADDLLPLIAEHTAAAVAAERERVAAAIEAMPCGHTQGTPWITDVHIGYERALDDAASIAREEHTDG